MELVYFFYESNSIRIPLFGYDDRLFRLFISAGGFWDRLKREFIFKRETDTERFKPITSYIPCVWVDEETDDTKYVLETVDFPADDLSEYCLPAELSRETKIIPEESLMQSVFTLPPRPVLPEKFSVCWQGRLDAELRSRKYSPRTRRCYMYYNNLFCRTIEKSPEEIKSDDLTRFLAIIEKDRDYSASSINLAISSIKFFYKNVIKKDIFYEHHRPSHDKRLPAVLSKDEICRILGAEKNPKHRLLLMLVYSSGLRVSEVVVLKREHIDPSRKVVYVRQGKGRKDRMTLLSEKAAVYITEYCAIYGIQTWLFPGQPVSRPLTIRSAQHIFDKAVRHAGIIKKISIHSLRHTFATHLLESGTDIRYIQSLLGHASLRTTERYTHVARRNILAIKSPLDTI